MALSRSAVTWWSLCLLLTACGGSSEPSGSIRCEYAGKTYDEGASFPSSDGCNSCRCSESGQVACTVRACAISCDDIATQYGALMEQAKTCDPGQPDQCQQRVTEGLRCGCETFVNASEWDGPGAQALTDAYSEASCGGDVVCGPCNVPVSASCSAAGVCVTDSDPTEGVACKVNGTIYPNGATNVPDPTSCNTCTCDEGRLSCTEIACPNPCPDATQLGTSCAQCGPTDACQVVETGCFPRCTDACDDGACIDGTCRTFCG